MWVQFPALPLTSWVTLDHGNDTIEQIDEDIAVTRSQTNFICPITQMTMKRPVRNKVCGHIYEEDAILEMIQTQKQKKKKVRCPKMGCSHVDVKGSDLVPDEILKRVLDSQKKQSWSTVDTEENALRKGLPGVGNVRISQGQVFISVTIAKAVFPLKHYQDKIRPYIQLPSHRNITGVVEVILGDTKAYVFFEKDFGDMHSYVRSCKRLREEEAARLFKQIVSAVAHCHQSAIVLGDLKLRKFVFSNEERTQLRLESLEDTHIIKGEDDALSDKHGCPAYVSPEILNTTGTYSGKSADVWSLGVMLYTLLVGRYPFHDSDPSTLFSKIRRGQFCIPDHVSPKARCLIRSLLRREPSERLTAPEILLHPWFEAVLEPGYTDQETGTSDQIVPEYHGDSDDISSFFC
ncbi:Tribbles 1 [Turdus rufiventris]|nr:Tribbles 1 [Turdus rufiventris]